MSDVCRWHGIISATFHDRKVKFSGMQASDATRLKALEDENAYLKRLYADAMRDSEPLCGIGPNADGDCATCVAIAHVVEVHEIRERPACDLIGLIGRDPLPQPASASATSCASSRANVVGSATRGFTCFRASRASW
jgi:hypothetical protein